eukprot:TRINITY_DN3918_c0_g1_i1.p1 TRINITY_DN3918_c0_g1~~TRINITY_DN3918_c0_g1_i1.p1  ORF type:complete len:955 (+),score=145.48 TRINITY_DN3918_c0_g1_i1:303-2867(+)
MLPVHSSTSQPISVSVGFGATRPFVAGAASWSPPRPPPPRSQTVKPRAPSPVPEKVSVPISSRVAQLTRAIEAACAERSSSRAPSPHGRPTPQPVRPAYAFQPSCAEKAALHVPTQHGGCTQQIARPAQSFQVSRAEQTALQPPSPHSGSSPQTARQACTFQAALQSETPHSGSSPHTARQAYSFQAAFQSETPHSGSSPQPARQAYGFQAALQSEAGRPADNPAPPLSVRATPAVACTSPSNVSKQSCSGSYLSASIGSMGTFSWNNAPSCTAGISESHHSSSSGLTRCWSATCATAGGSSRVQRAPPSTAATAARRAPAATWEACHDPSAAATTEQITVDEKRLRRGSTGLVFNPGSATVESQDKLGVSQRGAVNFCKSTPAPRHSLQALTDGELLARYISADTGSLTLQVFQALSERFDGSDSGRLRSSSWEAPFQRIRKNCATLPWRAKSIWDMLASRTKQPAYASAPLTCCRAVVCGAGPCGLRTALELALMRGQVLVVEKRSAENAFSRINRVHLWEYCKQDLLSWGAKTFDPPGGSFGGDNDFCHIGIGELQLLLLKSALLLGVEVRFSAEAVQLEGNVLHCSDRSQMPCDALIVAGGASSPLSRALGLRSVANELRGKGSAIGVVANFVNSRDPKEMALRQFSWARQFNQPLFQKLEERTRINLENVVYYKGQVQHYVVMTPAKKSLLEVGVLRKSDTLPGRLLHESNVDVQRLGDMVKQVARFFGLPTEMCASQGAMIFDFSGVQRLECPSTIEGSTFICAVGDALLEPFWPEGLGIMRGFMSAQDAAAAVALAAQGRRTDAVSQLANTYNVLKSVAAQTASQCLQKDIRQYTVDPKSRYIFSHY